MPELEKQINATECAYLGMLREACDCFTTKAGIIALEIELDHGSPVLTTRNLGPRLSKICQQTLQWLDRAKRFETSRLDSTLKGVCEKLSAAVTDLNSNLLPVWDQRAKISWFKIFFTEETYELAGGGRTLLEVWPGEIEQIKRVLETFSAEVTRICSEFPWAKEIWEC